MYKVDFVALHITKACSHRCAFCYCSSSKRDENPDFRKFIRIIKALAESGVSEVALLGGDPCEYPRILDLAERVKTLGMKTTVLSNTHKYPTKDSKLVTQVIDCFEATFHGPTAADHDAIALSDGAFENVVNNLLYLSDSAKSLGVVYNVTPGNCRQLAETLRYLKVDRGIPFDHLVVQRIVPQGRARTTSKFTIGRTHAIAALEDIDFLSRTFEISTFFEDPFPFCVIPARFHKYLSKCEWGFTRASIDCNGNLSRCGADPRYRFGNILDTPLLTIWNSSPILESFRSRKYLPEECRSCTLLEKCGGGCSLSCEIELDHGPDYLRFEPRNVSVGETETYSLEQAQREDLSDILRIEWACFPEYEFKFTPSSILKWYDYNPNMFLVLKDSRGRTLGYSCIVPLSIPGWLRIIKGHASSLQELRFDHVLKNGEPVVLFWHVEAVGTIADIRSRAGRALIRKTGELLLYLGNSVTACPITDIGLRLCKFFDFRPIAREKTPTRTYDIFQLNLKKIDLAETLKMF
jgi:radical SAM protein with 4Fe4S-binding SPASM domain